jgi:RNA polymerase sigma-70 factor, ECF subfamily
VRKMVLDHDDADDITQEVFIKLHDSLKEFRGDSKFFTYVYRIAMNHSLNHIKRSSKINNRKVDLLKADLIRNNHIEENIDAKKKSSLLEAAISSLPEQQRAVFNLRYYENLSYDEIAEILNRSTGGMKANYFHALKNIGKILKRDKAYPGYEEILDLNTK